MKHLEPVLISLLMALSAAPLASRAAESPQPVAPPEVVRLPAPAPGEAARWSSAGYDVLAAHPGEWVDLLVTPEQAQRLRTAGYALEPGPALPREVPEYFHTYDEMLAELQAQAAQHPDIARLEDIGDAWGKVYALATYPMLDLWALKISDHPASDEDEPVITYIGTQHGREPAGVEICLAIADSLLAGYGVDPLITRWVDEHETWIVPLANPDGHWCCATLAWRGWRKNARDNDGNGRITDPFHDEANWFWPDGVDLNRNYNWFWGTAMATHDPLGELYCGPDAFSEVECVALRDFYLRERPVFLVDYHSYGEYVLWSFGYDDSTAAPDDVTLAEVGTEIAARVPTWGGGWYLPLQANQTYPASGTASDWTYGLLNTFAFTIETCTWLYPGEEELDHAVGGNVAGALYLQERVDGPGVRGRLTAGGLPVEGTIFVEGIDDPALSASRRSHPVRGDYYRLLSPGTYDLRFEAAGWESQTVTGVVVPADTYVTLDIDLGSPSACGENADAARGGLRALPNPAWLGQPVMFRLPESAATHDARAMGERGGAAAPRVEIVDCQGRIVATLATGNTTATWHPGAGSAGERLGAGVYLARLRDAGPRVTCRFVLLGP